MLLLAVPSGVSLIEPDMLTPPNNFCSAPTLRSHLSSLEERVWPALKLVPVSQLLFGSDYPYREAVEAANGLRAYPFTDAERASINRETALHLMPGLAG